MQIKLVFIVTAGMTADVLLRGQLKALQTAGYEVSVVSSPDVDFTSAAAREGVQAISIPIAREINLLGDLVTLFRLMRYLQDAQPTIVNASTPKAGLLGMLAAWLARVPVRVYQQRGLRVETTAGLQRAILLWSERTAAACAHYVVCNSHSLRAQLDALRIGRGKLVVLGAGSSNGVDTQHYQPTTAVQRRAMRATLGIAQDVPVIGFIGRLTRDKGVLDLAAAFEQLCEVMPGVHLLLVGPFEQGDPLPDAMVEQIRHDPHITWVDYVRDTSAFYSAIDVLAFPSYREGLPNVPLEAAACAIPVVGYAATGTIDAVINGVTGLLVPVGATADLTARLRDVLCDDDLRLTLGMSARQYVLQNFDQSLVWRNWDAFYDNCLQQLVPPFRQARR